MSLDVYLMMDQTGLGVAADYLDEGGFGPVAQLLRHLATAEYQERRLYTANITHNLNRMAEAAGIYEPLWRPDEIGIQYAHQLIEPLTEGLRKLEADEAHYTQWNPANGWGSYESLVRFVGSYLEACRKFPFAAVEVSR